MVQKLSVKDILILFQKEPYKNTYAINVLSNIGNPHLAVTSATGFSIGNDLIVAYGYCFDGVQIHMEIEDASHLYEFHTVIEPFIHNFKEVMFSSPTDTIFHSPAFIELFGEHELTYNEQYGMFQDRTDINILKDGAVIRLLTAEDEAKVMAFDEPNLRDIYGHCIRTNEKSYALYAYFDDNSAILGYLIANTLNGSYWDIYNIYVSEKERGKGIAKSLARYYVKAIHDIGGFASYGTPANEASKKVAIACGFERFETQYLIKWESVSK